MTVEPGESVELRRPDGSPPSAVCLELGWRARGGGVLYASALMFAGDRRVDGVFFGKRWSGDGALWYGPVKLDALKHNALENPETIGVALDQVDRRVTRIAFVLLPYGDASLGALEWCDLRVGDQVTRRELAFVSVGSIDPHAGMMILAVLRRRRERRRWRRRSTDTWELKAVGATSTARRLEINAAILPHL